MNASRNPDPAGHPPCLQDEAAAQPVDRELYLHDSDDRDGKKPRCPSLLMARAALTRATPDKTTTTRIAGLPVMVAAWEVMRGSEGVVRWEEVQMALLTRRGSRNHGG